MHVHLLGTNGWFDSETGETPCILIDSEEAYVILDAGNGFRKIDRIIKDERKPIIVLLSHFHLDHCAGLHILPKFAFPQGISLIGQPGTKKALSVLLDAPFSAPIEMIRAKMPLEMGEIKAGTNRIGPIEIEAKPLVHKDPCFGFSFFLEGKKMTYCTDTGICKNMLALAKGSDLFICECAWKVRNQSPDWPHMAPEDAAETARDAGAKKLLLTHFDANQYKKRSERIDAQNRARKIFPNTVAGEDDMVIEL
jgi:ribonuclease BN (tRNA processing enzyme)